METAMHILLLDDNPSILALLALMIQRALGSEPCQIISARNGVEGMALLEAEESPDLIITNLRMPYMNGLDFIRQVRDNDRWARIPIVLISAEQSPKTVQAASDSGASGFVPKPFDYYAIKTMLSRFHAL
ncbi:MAG: response regulator [Aggregatilineales bacterium]